MYFMFKNEKHFLVQRDPFTICMSGNEVLFNDKEWFIQTIFGERVFKNLQLSIYFCYIIEPEQSSIMNADFNK